MSKSAWSCVFSITWLIGACLWFDMNHPVVGALWLFVSTGHLVRASI